MIVPILNHRVRPPDVAVRIRVRISALFAVRIHVLSGVFVPVPGRHLIVLVMNIFRPILGLYVRR